MLRKLGKGSSGAASRGGAVVSIIGPDVRIVGDIITQGEIQIDGQVEGDITCQSLVVGEGARLVGEVTAATVRIHGELTGKLIATHVTVARSAHVVGDIVHETLEMEAGGRLEGHLILKGSPAAKPAEEDAPEALAAQ